MTARTPFLWLRQTLELQDSAQSRLLPMEGLRGLAVSLVFLQHYSYQSLLLAEFDGIGGTVMRALRSYGNLGVELFFVLSGYLIYGTLIQRNTAFLRFMRRRAVRIYPAFLVAFLIYLAAVQMSPIDNKIPADPNERLVFFVTNLLLLPGLFPLPILMAVAWSLSYEMFFYLVSGAAARLLTLHEKQRRVRIGFVVAISLVFLLASLSLNWVPERMLPFFAGMLLAEGIGVSSFRTPGWLGLAAPPVALVASQAGVVPGQLLELLHTTAFFLLCSACFSGTFAAIVLSWTPARLLGNMSYSYYLLHGLSVVTLSVFAGRVAGLHLAPWMLWTALPFVFALSLIVPFMLFLFVERPISLRPPARQRVRGALV